MSQDVLGRRPSPDLAEAAALAAAAVAVARVVADPPDVPAEVRDALRPGDDAESRRGAGLLEESSASAEPLTRLAADHRRLFVGGPGHRPVASPTAPAEAAPALRRLRAEVVAAGVALPETPMPDLAQALMTCAALLTTDAAPPTEVERWYRELVDEHLLTWGARCLSRAQLGAQTFFYQGTAVLGLALLRSAASVLPPSVRP